LADLGAVQAAGPQPQRREQAIELLDRPAADQRQRTLETSLDGGERIREAARNRNSLGARREVEEGAVDIEEEPDLRWPQIRQVRLVHATVAFLDAPDITKAFQRQWFHFGDARKRFTAEAAACRKGRGVLRPLRVPLRPPR